MKGMTTGLKVVTFITYGLTGHDLDAATIFAALQLFNILLDPIQALPMQLAAIMDFMSGVRRIQEMLCVSAIRPHCYLEQASEYILISVR